MKLLVMIINSCCCSQMINKYTKVLYSSSIHSLYVKPVSEKKISSCTYQMRGILDVWQEYTKVIHVHVHVYGWYTD